MRIPAACSSSGDDGGDGNARKARVFFERGRKAAYDGRYEYAIEMFLSGLAIDPDNLQAHRELREIFLKRKAGGGKDLGMFKKMALKRWTSDAKQNCSTPSNCWHTILAIAIQCFSSLKPPMPLGSSRPPTGPNAFSNWLPE